MTSKLLIVLALLAVINAASVATINADKTYQVIRGFGGINLPDWGVDLTESQRKTAFTNCDNCLGFTVLRVYVSDDSNAWKKSVLLQNMLNNKVLQFLQLHGILQQVCVNNSVLVEDQEKD